MSRVPSLVEKENERLRLSMETIFRVVVLNLLVCSSDESATMRWMQKQVQRIYRDKVDWDEEAASQQERKDG